MSVPPGVPPDVAPVTPPQANGTNGTHGDGSAPGAGGGAAGGGGPFLGPFTLRPTAGRPWYKRWGLWVAVAVVVVAASVVADLPEPQSVQQQASVAAGVVREIATSIHPCVYATTQAFTIYDGYTKGTFAKADRGFVPQYLSEDQQECTLANSTIFSISTITVPNSPAGDVLDSVIKTTLEWSTSDAVGAIVDIETLVHHPADKKALRDLASREKVMDVDRSKAQRQIRSAERDLHGSPLPGLGIPSVHALLDPAP